jgi:CRISPR system Cascade subunit CasC
MKTLFEIHALQNFAPSNLNRDDTGSPKDALFGGTRRARISSQCQKRAVRQSFKGILDPDDIGLHTKRLLELLPDALEKKGRSRTEAEGKIRAALASVKLSINEDGKSQYLLFLGQREIAKLATILHEKWESIGVPVNEPSGAKKGKKSKKQAAQEADPELKKALEKVFDGGKAVDVALFGRMLADMPEKNQNAACQVAHAISTHAVEPEFDYYTAVDDSKPEDKPGADMIGDVPFNSACYYRYAVVDWEKLVENLQGDAHLARKGLRAFVEGFCISEPTGKQNAFAAHNPPEFIAISVRHNTAPRSLANAFETVVQVRKGESLTQRSVEMLLKKAQVLQGAYGGDGTTHVLNLTDAKSDKFGTSVTTLKDLLDKTLEAVSKVKE